MDPEARIQAGYYTGAQSNVLKQNNNYNSSTKAELRGYKADVLAWERSAHHMNTPRGNRWQWTLDIC